jgi:anti-anti-sigma factor
VPGDSPVTVYAAGDYDVSNIDDLREQIALACAGLPERVVVDLTRVSFMGAAAVDVLVAASDYQCAHDGDLRVVADESGIARKVLTVCGLDHLIDDSRVSAEGDVAGRVDVSGQPPRA